MRWQRGRNQHSSFGGAARVSEGAWSLFCVLPALTHSHILPLCPPPHTHPHTHTQELLDSGYLTEVHKFSKFIHGTCTLFPEMVQVKGLA